MKIELVDPYAPRAERLWRALEAAQPPAYFLSWGWVENWLACLPRDRAPRLAVIDDGASACFLTRRLAFHRGVVPSRTVYLNVTGVPRLDDLWIEYNGLVGRDYPLDELLDALPFSWDEVALPGLAESAFGKLASRYRIVRRDVPAYFVPLDRVRAADKGYLSLVSSQTRNQIRRAQREAGAVEVTFARDEAEAIEIYGELTALHAAQWHAKNDPGAFADPWIDRFHRRLIATRFQHGEIQLVRVRNGDHTVGCLYNFVYRGRVLQYQGGLAMYDDSKKKPGYVCHTAAIEHAAAAGHDVYDFLGGDFRYKKSLATESTSLVWATVQKRRVRFAIEDKIVEAVRARRQAASNGGNGGALRSLVFAMSAAGAASATAQESEIWAETSSEISERERHDDCSS